MQIFGIEGFQRAAFQADLCDAEFAHITGGGMYENTIRVIPKGLDIDVDFSSWQRPKIFDLIQSAGIEEEEMRKVFNLGIGYVFIIDPKDFDELSASLAPLGDKPTIIGKVTKCR